MTKTLIRGRLLSFRSQPRDITDTDSYLFESDGAVLVENGLILASGAYDSVKAEADAQTLEIDHRPHLILPGFIDCHVHFPQMQVIGSYAANLLEWLNTYTFPEECRFVETAHAARIATHFFDEFLRQGTTTAVAYCSVHKTSADAFFAESARRGTRMIAGKVMMDRNAPQGLLDTPQSGYDETKELIESWHGRGRNLVAITPRFAITSTPEQMERTRALAHEFPDLHIQTHLSENREEIDFTSSLYPESSDYTDIYARYGLLGCKTLFGHAIHLSEREADALAESGSVAVHCPTSNLFLGSGLFPLKAIQRRDMPVRVALATDIGGGTSYSMLRTLDEAYKIQQLLGERLNPLDSFYHMTLGNAEALSLSDKIGTLDPGTEADLVVLNAHATPAMALKMEAVTSLTEELFLMQTLGDDRVVVETYVAGVASKPRI
ncbi:MULTISPECIES: guanine deaminase [Rhizobium/Agrobacterium group]|uniref:Guanine deaminase n=2 Tax=Rhizobium/Agrobacterium group TaxID=227290 RepID=B9JZS2_ALLAM|nr:MULTISPECIES: guanine deaminase [Rhizobium/Agrobacterium group]ACM37382.1 guanine deaminase [Allorhizobium ampelinum S4]MCF1450115.1 guanine deaminase [Allorhizobium ampelinum]MUO30100.1 guanine deaminase [Agrobacterium vitis]MUO45158.1 guanine deaminase [Agrobacterium vitis]MUP12801.1 guanine deaminase [Agrobacterium vitis]